MMLAKTPTAEQAFGILTKHARHVGDYTYWGREELPPPPTKWENQKPFSLPRLPYEFDTLNIETTAYALLTYVSRRELLVEPIVRWLINQRLTDGGWASTQDTGVALKALIEYTVRTRIRDVSQLSISVEPSSTSKTHTFHINDQNLAELQTLNVNIHHNNSFNWFIFSVEFIFTFSMFFHSRSQMHGEPLRCKPRELVSQFCRCTFSTMLISRNSKRSHPCHHSNWSRAWSSMAEISRISHMFHAKGKL